MLTNSNRSPVSSGELLSSGQLTDIINGIRLAGQYYSEQPQYNYMSTATAQIANPTASAFATSSPSRVVGFVRFRAEAAEKYAAIPLFNQQCIYPVVNNDGADDIIVEISPLAGYGQSSKLVVPRSLIDIQVDHLTELVKPGAWMAYSPQFIGLDDNSIRHYFAIGWPRKDVSIKIAAAPSNPAHIGQSVICTIPVDHGSSVHNVVLPIHILVPVVVMAEKKEPETTKKKKNDNTPKKSDAGKLCRVIEIDKASPSAVVGSVWALNSFNEYRQRWSLYNGTVEINVAPRCVELVTTNELGKSGDMFTQSDSWLVRNGPSIATRGLGVLATLPGVARLIDWGAYSCVTVVFISTRGSALTTISCPYSDLRRLTDEEAKAVSEVLNPTNIKDEAWVRKSINPALMKVIDRTPTSPFLHAALVGLYNIVLPQDAKTTKEIMAKVVEGADNIKSTEAEAVLKLPVVVPAPSAAEVVTTQPEVERPTPANVPEIPAATVAADDDGDDDDMDDLDMAAIEREVARI